MTYINQTSSLAALLCDGWVCVAVRCNEHCTERLTKISKSNRIHCGAAIAQSVQRRATGWTVLVGGEIFRTRSERPWGPPSLLYSGYRVFSGGKAAGAWR